MSKKLPTYDESTKRFNLVLDDCKNFEPPLTDKEAASIWVACRTGRPVFLRNKEVTSQRDGALLKAARDVVWFDWSGNDADAVAAIERLRVAVSGVHEKA